jgi:hypothetical protein
LRPPAAGARVLLGLAALLLSAAAWWSLRSGERLHAQSGGTANPSPPIRVEADAGVMAEGPAAEPYAVCRLTPPSKEADAAWTRFAPLDGTRIAASSGAESLPAYGARIADGAAILLVNHGEEKAEFRLSVRLPRGVYAIERCGFDSQKPETLPQVERLESVILDKAGAISKPGWLNPRMASVYRFRNCSAQTQAACADVLNNVRAFMQSRPAAFRQLMIPLRECADHVGALSSGVTNANRYERLKHIHRALLTLAHAQSLCQNFQSEGRLSRQEESALETALDRLEEMLTDLSAGCLDLVPGLTVAPPDPIRPDARIVTISLTNAGQKSVAFVRIGANAPTGCAVRPAEQALFNSIRPGETARATFTVTLDTDASERLITADIAYFAARAPAHLRLKMRE